MINSSLQYRREDGKRKFVHDTIRDFFHAEFMAESGHDVTPHISDIKHHGMLMFYSAMVDDCSKLLDQIFGQYTQIKSKYIGKEFMDARTCLDMIDERCCDYKLREGLAKDYLRMLEEDPFSVDLILLCSNCYKAAKNPPQSKITDTTLSYELWDMKKALQKHPQYYSGYLLPANRVRSAFNFVSEGNNELIEKFIQKSSKTYEGWAFNGEYMGALVTIGSKEPRVWNHLRMHMHDCGGHQLKDCIHMLSDASNDCAFEILKDLINGRYGEVMGMEGGSSYWEESAIYETMGVICFNPHPKAVKMLDDLLLKGTESCDRSDFARMLASLKHHHKRPHIMALMEKHKDDEDPAFREIIRAAIKG